VITCVGTGPFNFGAITISGGASVTVSNTSSAATYNFSGVINASSSAGLTFNGGTGAIYNMENGLVTGGSAPVTFSAGTFHMGTNTNCGAGYSICASATMTIAGPSTFALVGGIYNGGGSTLALGTINNSCAGSTSNSYNIGAAANGNSINIGGGAITTLCDASGAGDLFQTAGSIVSGSGGVVTLPAAAEHDINGNMSLSGNVTFGAGVYTVVGYVSLGQGITVNGNGVTFVLGGANACATGMALCVASGVAGTLTAPSSGAAPALTGLRLFAVVALGLLTFIATSLAPLFAPSRTLSMLFGMAGGVIGYFVPTMVIHRLVKKHAKAVVAGLPDALELMVICVEAGIAFEDGIDRVAAELRNTQPALAEELALTSADLKILPSRDQALANLAERIDMPSVRSVATTLSQTLRYGTPLTQALRVVAAELRNDTLVRLEERANQLPTLMTIPMMLFILPTLFIIVAGPAALRVIDTFFR
jgi:tight adherence protein C